MKESLELKETFRVEPSRLYRAWLDSKYHSEMTGGHAECSDEVGGSFTAWDGYINGKNISLTPNEEIIQAWRTSEFDKNDEDSMLTIRFRKKDDGTEMILQHENIPEGQTQYREGWIENYLRPMKAYFDMMKD